MIEELKNWLKNALESHKDANKDYSLGWAGGLKCVLNRIEYLEIESIKKKLEEAAYQAEMDKKLSIVAKKAEEIEKTETSANNLCLIPTDEDCINATKEHIKNMGFKGVNIKNGNTKTNPLNIQDALILLDYYESKCFNTVGNTRVLANREYYNQYLTCYNWINNTTKKYENDKSN